MKKLYVGNLPYSVTNESLAQLFEAFEVISAVVIVDKFSGRSKGFGFVEVEKGDEALAEMNGKEIDGRALKVDEAKPREE